MTPKHTRYTRQLSNQQRPRIPPKSSSCMDDAARDGLANIKRQVEQRAVALNSTLQPR